MFVNVWKLRRPRKFLCFLVSDWNTHSWTVPLTFTYISKCLEVVFCVSINKFFSTAKVFLVGEGEEECLLHLYDFKNRIPEQMSAFIYRKRIHLFVFVMPATSTCSALWGVALVSQEGRHICPPSNYCSPPRALAGRLLCWGLLGRREVLNQGSSGSCYIVREPIQPSKAQGTVSMGLACCNCRIASLASGEEAVKMGITQTSSCWYPAHATCLRRAQGSLKVNFLLGFYIDCGRFSPLWWSCSFIMFDETYEGFKKSLSDMCKKEKKGN